MIATCQGWCGRSTSRAIVVCRAAGTVELTSRGILVIARSEQPVDRARAVENAKNAFPTNSLHAHRTRAHTLHRHSPRDHMIKSHVNMPLPNNVRRMKRHTAVVASLR